MGWTGNSTANWEMGYFKTIPGNGWEMGRVKMGEHCAKLVKPKQSRGNLGSAWNLPCIQKGAVFRSHADVGALRSAFISYPCAFLNGPTSSTFCNARGFSRGSLQL